MSKVNNKDLFGHNSHLVLVFLLLNFEHVIAGWAVILIVNIFDMTNNI